MNYVFMPAFFAKIPVNPSIFTGIANKIFQFDKIRFFSTNVI